MNPLFTELDDFLRKTILKLKYGKGSCEAPWQEATPAKWLEPRCPTPSDPPQLLRTALGQPFGSPPLHHLARGLRSAAILVPGKDRLAGVDQFLPLLLEELGAAGVPEEGITVVLATGSHVSHTPEEVSTIMGPASFQKVRWRQHNCRPDGQFVALGTTAFGTPVEIDSEVMSADIKILTGLIIPHYFAGFGGGRKALLPGVSAFHSIRKNHRLTLGPAGGIHPAVRHCSLKGNPVHEDMLDAARRVPSVFILNTLVDQENRIVSAVAGDLEEAHAEGCERATAWYSVPIESPVDAAITSAGGWPYDCDFVQSLKAVFAVKEIVRPGGAILWLAECAQGMKEGFLRWAEIRSDEALDAAVRANYDLAGHNTIMLRALLRQVRVGFVSGLPDEAVKALGLVPLHSLAEGLDWLRAVSPPNYQCAVIPFGNITHARIGEKGPES